MPSQTLLDTDTLSYLMRGQPQALANAQAYRAVHGLYTISAMTQYEVLKGLNAKGAVTRLRLFEQFTQRNIVLPLNEEVLRQGAAIYGDLRRRGVIIGDADILIAATAVEHGLTLITNNEKHFSRIRGLQVDNWLR